MGETIGPGGGSGTGSTGGGGIATGVASTSTASVALVTPASNTPFTPSTTLDSTVIFQFATAGTIVVTIGPTVGNENNLAINAAVAVNELAVFPCPANWKMVITLTTATLTQTKVVTQ